MCIVNACLPGYGIINFEINLIFIIKPFSYLIKNSAQKIEYFKNKNSFQHEIKRTFHYF